MSVSLSIVVPAFNEASRLPATAKALLAWLDAHAPDGELILVDDGSTDPTAALIRDLERDEARVRGVFGTHNRGKGGALREGVARSRGEIVQLHDADLSYPLAAMAKARARIEAGAHLVLGARDLAPTDSRRRYGLARRAGSQGFNLFVELALGLGISDTQCGFKQLQGEAARALFAASREEGFAFDVELIALARAWHLRLERLPLEMTVRPGSSVRLLRDSWRMFREVLAVRQRVRRGRYRSRPKTLI